EGGGGRGGGGGRQCVGGERGEIAVDLIGGVRELAHGRLEPRLRRAGIGLRTGRVCRRRQPREADQELDVAAHRQRRNRQGQRISRAGHQQIAGRPRRGQQRP